VNVQCQRITLFACLLLLCAGCSLTPSRPPPEAAPRAPGQPHPADIVSQIAVSMIGAPYRYGGSSPEGFDCSGLVYYAHVKAGVPVPRTAAEQHAQSRTVATQQLQPGDILFFDTSWRYGHVGIYVGNGEFVHAPSSGKRVSRASIREGYFAKRLKKAGRLIDDQRKAQDHQPAAIP
jgi:cell wall-associated NlpC family hydrolase